jgi:hypothetical protein
MGLEMEAGSSVEEVVENWRWGCDPRMAIESRSTLEALEMWMRRGALHILKVAMFRSRALHDKRPVAQLLNNLLIFYGIQEFMALFTRACHCSLSSSRLMQFISPHLISLRFNLILFSYICLNFSDGYFLQILPSKLTCNSTCPAYLLDLDMMAKDNLPFLQNKKQTLWL